MDAKMNEKLMIIVGGGKPTEEEKTGEMNLKEECAKEILMAISKKDSKMLASALETFLECCGTEEMEEDEGTEDESEMMED